MRLSARIHTTHSRYLGTADTPRITTPHVRTAASSRYFRLYLRLQSQPPLFPSYLVKNTMKITILILLLSLSFCAAELVRVERRAAPALSASLSAQTSTASSSASSTTCTDGARVTSPPVLGEGVVLQEKWHLTTFWSCHTFDQTATFCGL